MTLHIYDTFQRKKVAFVPVDPAHIRLYVCGPTVYDRAHIGNARPVVVFDVLSRLLRRCYPKVTYARNITDVDDKIIKAAKEKGIQIQELTELTTRQYNQDMAALKAHAPDLTPKATENIDAMIAMIQTLIDRGHAYEAEGHVLFQVSTFDKYGQLSNRTLEEMVAGARVEIAPYKKEPADFVLWKPSSEDQPGWESPWGRGRPGWHIECSAMTKAFLGETFDIHGGGCDLVFPHHENERAQSLCSSQEQGAEFAKYWMHNGHLTVDSTKMSKSLGNFFTVDDLLGHYPGEVIRFALLSAHYRQPLDWTEDLLTQAKKALDKFYGALKDVDVKDHANEDAVPDDVWAALNDDLNTPLAISHLHQLATAVNRTDDMAEKVKKAGQLKAAGNLLGLLGDEPACWFQDLEGVDHNTCAKIDALIAERNAARAAKDFARADQARDELTALNVVLEDGPQGTTWRWKT